MMCILDTFLMTTLLFTYDLLFPIQVGLVFQEKKKGVWDVFIIDISITSLVRMP